MKILRRRDPIRNLMIPKCKILASESIYRSSLLNKQLQVAVLQATVGCGATAPSVILNVEGELTYETE